MILGTFVLPRSRFLMAVHHNNDLTCSVRVVDIGEERRLLFTFACLLSLCHLGLFSLYAIMAKGWHSSTSSRTQQVHSSLDVHIHGHGLSRHTQLVYRSAGRDLEHHASRNTCGFLSLPLNLGQCARGWSPAHVPKASHVEAVHKLRDAL